MAKFKVGDICRVTDNNFGLDCFFPIEIDDKVEILGYDDDEDVVPWCKFLDKEFDDSDSYPMSEDQLELVED